MRGVRLAFAAWVALGVAGCSEPSVAVDAGADAAPDAAAPMPPAPDIPWLADGVPAVAAPSLTPCPAGWREVVEADGLARCEPYPEGGPEDCPFGEAHFPGEPGCALVGSACPAGEWPEGLPHDGSVLFVRAGAVGGDGTRDAPLGTVTDAAARAGDGAIIALAKGLHTYPAVVRRPVELRGACAAETRLTSPEGIIGLRIAQTDVRVRDLSIVDAGAPAILVDGPDASLELDGVVIARAQLAGVLAFEATVTGRTVLVSDTQGSPEGGGSGLVSHEGSWIRLDRVVLERNHEAGAVAWRTGAGVALRSAAVRDTLPFAGLHGYGVAAREGGRVELEACLLARNHTAGASAVGSGSHLVLTDVLVRDTAAATDPRTAGVDLDLGASAELSRVLVERNANLGILVTGPGGNVIATDTVIRLTSPEPFGFGQGVQVVAATAQLARVLVADNTEVGVLAGAEGTELTVSDVLVRGTRPNGAGWGRGVSVQMGAVADIARALVEESHEVGLEATGAGARVTVTDVAVRRTRGNASTGTFGRGLNVQHGAVLEGSRVLLAENHELGAFAGGAGTRISLVDAVVRDTRERECAETTCASAPAGSGVGSYDGAAVSLSRFAVLRSPLCGLQLARGAEMDLMGGEIAESSVGVCLQVADYDLGRLTNEVLFRDNGRTLEATDFPVPGPTDPE